MHRLYCAPLGETARGLFIEGFIAALREGRSSETAFLEPSSYLLGLVRTALRDAGLAGHEHPQLFSLDDLVRDIAQLAGERRFFMNRMAQEILVEELLAELTGTGELPYFGQVAALPGCVGAITSLLAEIKRSGATPAELAGAAEAAELTDKFQELAVIYERYQECLARRELADLEELYLLAIGALRGGAALPYRHLYICDFDILSPLQLELINELRQTVSLDIGLAYEANRPEVFAAVEPTYGALVGMGFTPCQLSRSTSEGSPLAHIREQLFRPEPQRVVPEQVGYIRAASQQQEMAAVAAKIKELLLTSHRKPEDFAVVIRDAECAGRFREVCDRYGLPVSMGREVKLAEHSLTRALFHLIAARLTNGSRAAVINLAKSPFISDMTGLDAEDLEYRALDRLITDWEDWLALGNQLGAEAGSELSQGLIALRRMVLILPSEGTGEQFAAAIDGWLSGLSVPQSLGTVYRRGEISLAELKAGLLTCQGISEATAAVCRGLAGVGAGERRFSLGDYSHLLAKVLEEAALRLEDFCETAVQIISPAGARGVRFPSVFIIGLTDGAFPRPARENWLLSDSERVLLGDLGIGFTTAKGRRTEENLFFAVAASLAGESLTLSWQEDDTHIPSPFVEEVARLFTAAVPADDYPANRLFEQDYRRIFTGRDLVGRLLLDAYSGGKPGEVPEAAIAPVADLLDSDFVRRVLAEATRSAGTGGLYGGDLLWQETADDPAQLFSITALETFALCPFAYFAGRVLKLADWAEQEEEAGLDVIGTICHETLARFLRRHLGEKLRPEQEDSYRQELSRHLAEVAAEMAARGEIVAGPVWDFRQYRLQQTLQRWLRFEIREQNKEGLAFRPAHLEWGFGLSQRPGMDPASVTAPLTIAEDGETVAIAGKVDRVDRAGDKLALIDYKRNRCPQYSALAKGLDLQAALYIMAVEALLQPGGEVAGGGYYSVEGCKKEGGMWRAELAKDIPHRASKDAGNLPAETWHEVQAELRRRVLAYTRQIRQGHFPVAPQADCPPYCPGAAVCRYQPGEQDTGGEQDG